MSKAYMPKTNMKKRENMERSCIWLPKAWLNILREITELKKESGISTFVRNAVGEKLARMGYLNEEERRVFGVDKYET